MSVWILDTGPLVAWFCVKDTHHEWSKSALGSLTSAGLVCEAVLTEACHLVRKDGVDPARVLDFVSRGALQAIPLHDRLVAIRDRMRKYADQQIDFADACVMELAEMFPEATLCTADTDFRIFRFNSGAAPKLLAPF
jgi:predicted nucleic acid-binding protein